MIQIGIILAVCCALVTNLAFFYKQRGAALAPAVRPGHPLRSARDLFRSRWFTIGMLVAVGAWLQAGSCSSVSWPPAASASPSSAANGSGLA
jgi:hypothetical protein